MTKSSQEQNAGNNSTQIQAGTIQNAFITNVTGIDEARARVIWQEEYAVAKQNWTLEANEIAEQRVRELENRLIPKMLEYDASLRAFADPSYQISMMKAQISAASSERSSDYDILSELLVHRIEQGENRVRRLGISKAIEIVDQVDDNALIALSLVYAVSKFYPISCLVDQGLLKLEELYKKITSGRELPSGTGWMEHLDLLSTIRIGTRGFNSFKKFEEIIPDKLKGIMPLGIQEDSNKLTEIKDKLRSIAIDSSVIVPNPLKTGYVVLSMPTDLNTMTREYQFSGQTVNLPLTDKEKEVLSDIFAVMHNPNNSDQEMLTKLWEKWDSYPNLNKIHKWWNELPVSFDFTPVGVALSNAYIHGIDNTIPCMY